MGRLLISFLSTSLRGWSGALSFAGALPLSLESRSHCVPTHHIYNHRTIRTYTASFLFFTQVRGTMRTYTASSLSLTHSVFFFFFFSLSSWGLLLLMKK